MKLIYWYLIPTAMIILVLIRQIKIIIYSPKGDQHLKSKVAFLVFSLFFMSGMWFCAFKFPDMAFVFYLGMAMISLWTYLSKNSTINKNDEL